MSAPDTDEFKYCMFCGSKMTTTLITCPNCGRNQNTGKSEISNPNETFGSHFSWNMKTVRIVIFLLFMGIFLIGLLIGSQAFITADQAQFLVNSVTGSVASGSIPLDIFLNNMFICLIFFLPGLGALFLVFVSYNTGVVLSATAIISGMPSLELFLTLLLVPSTWLEIMAYSLAANEGTLLILSILKKHFKRELRTLAKTVLICAALLTVGAIVESILISML